jgi:hypothetical protein
MTMLRRSHGEATRSLRPDVSWLAMPRCRVVQGRLAAVAVAACFASLGCARSTLRELHVGDAVDGRGTEIDARLEVFGGRRPGPGDFRVYHDGRRLRAPIDASAGSFSIPVALVLDDTVTDPDAVEPLRSTVTRFVAALAADGHDVTILTFDRELQTLWSIHDYHPHVGPAPADVTLFRAVLAANRELWPGGAIVVLSVLEEGFASYDADTFAEVAEVFGADRQSVFVVGLHEGRRTSDVGPPASVVWAGRLAGVGRARPRIVRSPRALGAAFASVRRRLPHGYIVHHVVPDVAGRHAAAYRVRGGPTTPPTMWRRWEVDDARAQPLRSGVLDLEGPCRFAWSQQGRSAFCVEPEPAPTRRARPRARVGPWPRG